MCEKRPICIVRPLPNQLHSYFMVCVKRDLYMCEKRPICTVSPLPNQFHCYFTKIIVLSNSGAT